MTPTPPPAWAMKAAENAFAHPMPNDSIMQSVARAIAAERERAAQKADKWNEISDQQIRLMAGEMTAQEIQTAKAVAAGIASAIRKGD